MYTVALQKYIAFILYFSLKQRQPMAAFIGEITKKILFRQILYSKGIKKYLLDFRAKYGIFGFEWNC